MLKHKANNYFHPFSERVSFSVHNNEANCVLVKHEADGFYHVRYWDYNVDKKFASHRSANIAAISLARANNTYAIDIRGYVMLEDMHDIVEELAG